MAGSEPSPIDFSYDEKFRDDLHTIKDNDPSIAESLIDRCEAIRQNPFKGEWKKWAMDGLYGLHAGEKVILYQIEPDLSPNSSRENVEQVYFWRIVHHDDQRGAVVNLDESDTERSVRIFLDYSQYKDANQDLRGERISPEEHANLIHNAELLATRENEYTAEGIFFECDLLGEESELEELLPDIVQTEIVEPSVSEALQE